MDWYKEKYFPGCGKSIDMVHLKWIKYPAGVYKGSKGTKGYSLIAFEVITWYDLFEVSSIHFGTQYNQPIIQTNETFSLI